MIEVFNHLKDSQGQARLVLFDNEFNHETNKLTTNLFWLATMYNQRYVIMLDRFNKPVLELELPIGFLRHPEHIIVAHQIELRGKSIG